MVIKVSLRTKLVVKFETKPKKKSVRIFWSKNHRRWNQINLSISFLFALTFRLVAKWKADLSIWYGINYDFASCRFRIWIIRIIVLPILSWLVGATHKIGFLTKKSDNFSIFSLFGFNFTEKRIKFKLVSWRFVHSLWFRVPINVQSLLTVLRFFVCVSK